jgi:hypothetical protein
LTFCNTTNAYTRSRRFIKLNFELSLQTKKHWNIQ